MRGVGGKGGMPLSCGNLRSRFTRGRDHEHLCVLLLDVKNRSGLHQRPQIPGDGNFLPAPKFLPKSAAKRSRNVIRPGHSRKLERSARMRYQPSKLVVQQQG
jgi:hypothetical protein